MFGSIAYIIEPTLSRTDLAVTYVFIRWLWISYAFLNISFVVSDSASWSDLRAWEVRIGSFEDFDLRSVRISSLGTRFSSFPPWPNLAYVVIQLLLIDS